MKVLLGNVAEVFDGVRLPSLAARLRALISDLERVFLSVRVDDSIIIGGGTLITKHLSATATWNPADVVAGAQITQTINVPGAALGDEVTVSFSLSLQGMQLTGYVSTADTVTVVLSNGTAGDLNLAEGTLRASVWRH